MSSTNAKVVIILESSNSNFKKRTCSLLGDHVVTLQSLYLLNSISPPFRMFFFVFVYKRGVRLRSILIFMNFFCVKINCFFSPSLFIFIFFLRTPQQQHYKNWLYMRRQPTDQVINFLYFIEELLCICCALAQSEWNFSQNYVSKQKLIECSIVCWIIERIILIWVSHETNFIIARRNALNFIVFHTYM